MLQLSLGIFCLLALVLALRESVHSAHEEEDDGFIHASTGALDSRAYDAEVLEEVIEEMICLQAEAVDAVSALTITLHESPANTVSEPAPAYVLQRS